MQAQTKDKIWAVRFLLLIAGLGGLLYGIDVGIIAGALPYLQDTAKISWQLTQSQISYVVAAVLLGGTLSSLFAGMLSDFLGRRTMMFLSGLLFVISIPTIALASGYTPLLLGRLLQGMSGGFIGVVIPLYLAECLPPSSRGKGTAIFQWLLTAGLVVAALIGQHYGTRVEGVTKAASDSTAAVEQVLVAKKDFAAKQTSPADKQAADAQVSAAQKDLAAAQQTAEQEVLDVKELAWRRIFWASILPGILFTIGTLMIAESARWLFQRGKKEAARAALLRTLSPDEAEREFTEMEETALNARRSAETATAGGGDSLLSRKYVLPFFIACVILACNQATGVNSILAYVVNILNQAGLDGASAHDGDVFLKILNCIMTVVAVILVDRAGRKALLMIGSAGIIVSLGLVGWLFLNEENRCVDARAVVQAMVKNESSLALNTSEDSLSKAIKEAGGGEALLAPEAKDRPLQITIAYSYGPFTDIKIQRSDDVNPEIKIDRKDALPHGDLDTSLDKFLRALRLGGGPDPVLVNASHLEIKKAMIGRVPGAAHGRLVTLALFGFMAFFAVGPGVCVWLALSELMPTRIRSNGMSIALLLNQFVSAGIAAVFLPTVGLHGYSSMFFFFSGCTVVYFLTAAFLLPETKGKTLEEIEEHFSRGK